MDYKIIKKEGFQLAGLSRKVTTKDGKNNIIIPKFWQEICEDGIVEKMETQADIKYGVCYDSGFEQEYFRYMIGIEGNLIDGVDGCEILEVPESTWAIFESVGPMPHAIQNVWKRIYSEWFPATKYEHANTPELEVYLLGDADAEDYHCQIWIPIIEKQ